MGRSADGRGLTYVSLLPYDLNVAQDKTVLTLMYRVSLHSAFIGFTSVVLQAFAD